MMKSIPPCNANTAKPHKMMEDEDEERSAFHFWSREELIQPVQDKDSDDLGYSLLVRRRTAFSTEQSNCLSTCSQAVRRIAATTSTLS